jgi:hypothetical protein
MIMFRPIPSLRDSLIVDFGPTSHSTIDSVPTITDLEEAPDELA